jgi:hypothetical protein
MVISIRFQGSRGQHWMWVARVLRRSDEYMRWPPASLQGRELQEAASGTEFEKLAKSLLLVAYSYSGVVTLGRLNDILGV